MPNTLPKHRRRHKLVTKNTTVIVETCRGQPDRVTLISDLHSLISMQCKGGNPPVSPILKEEMNKAWQERCEIAEKRLREAGILGPKKGD